MKPSHPVDKNKSSRSQVEEYDPLAVVTHKSKEPEPQRKKEKEIEYDPLNKIAKPDKLEKSTSSRPIQQHQPPPQKRYPEHHETSNKPVKGSQPIQKSENMKPAKRSEFRGPLWA